MVYMIGRNRVNMQALLGLVEVTLATGVITDTFTLKKKTYSLHPKHLMVYS